jgi:hypothetical protein
VEKIIRFSLILSPFAFKKGGVAKW